MITMISLLTSIISYKIQIKEKKCFFLEMRTLRIYSLNSFQIL